MVFNVLQLSCKLKFIDCARCFTTSLSNLVDNLTERIHKIKYKDCDCFLQYESVKDKLIKYKFLSCNNDYSNDDKPRKPFKSTFKFSNNDMNKSILVLREGVYPHGYMDEWENVNQTALPEK